MTGVSDDMLYQQNNPVESFFVKCKNSVAGKYEARMAEIDFNSNEIRIISDHRKSKFVEYEQIPIDRIQRYERSQLDPQYVKLILSKEKISITSTLSSDMELIFEDLSSMDSFTRALSSSRFLVPEYTPGSEETKTEPDQYLNPSHSQSDISSTNNPMSPHYGELTSNNKEVMHTVQNLGMNSVDENAKDKHVKEWVRMVDKLRKSGDADIKKLIRKGVPSNLRSEVWSLLANVDEMKRRAGVNYYSNLLSSSNEDQYRQVNNDIDRHLCVAQSENLNARIIRKVLRAYNVHNPRIGFSSSVTFIAAILALMFLDGKTSEIKESDEENAFWVLSYFIEVLCCVQVPYQDRVTSNTPPSSPLYGAADYEQDFEVKKDDMYIKKHKLMVKLYYHDRDRLGLKIDQLALQSLTAEKLPKIYSKLEQLRIPLGPLTVNWFTGLLVNTLPLDLVLRIWDCFLHEGIKVMFRAELTILKMNEKAILKAETKQELIASLVAFTKTPLDTNEFINIMFGLWLGSFSMAKIQRFRDIHSTLLATPSKINSALAASQGMSVPQSQGTQVSNQNVHNMHNVQRVDESTQSVSNSVVTPALASGSDSASERTSSSMRQRRAMSVRATDGVSKKLTPGQAQALSATGSINPSQNLNITTAASARRLTKLASVSNPNRTPSVSDSDSYAASKLPQPITQAPASSPLVNTTIRTTLTSTATTASHRDLRSDITVTRSSTLAQLLSNGQFNQQLTPSSDSHNTDSAYLSPLIYKSKNLVMKDQGPLSSDTESDGIISAMSDATTSEDDIQTSTVATNDDMAHVESGTETETDTYIDIQTTTLPRVDEDADDVNIIADAIVDQSQAIREGILPPTPGDKKQDDIGDESARPVLSQLQYNSSSEASDEDVVYAQVEATGAVVDSDTGDSSSSTKIIHSGPALTRRRSSSPPPPPSAKKNFHADLPLPKPEDDTDVYVPTATIVSHETSQVFTSAPLPSLPGQDYDIHISNTALPSDPAPNPDAMEDNEMADEEVIFWPSTAPVSSSYQSDDTQNNTILQGLEGFQNLSGALVHDTRRCEGCNEAILTDAVFAMGSLWHREHFRCAGACKRPLYGLAFYGYQGSPYCEEDYIEVAMVQTCKVCGLRAREAISCHADNSFVHPHCVYCHVCHKSPTMYELSTMGQGESFHCAKHPTLESYEFFCYDHYCETFYPACHRCSKPILSNGLKLNDNAYHSHCLACAVCDKDVKTASKDDFGIFNSNVFTGTFYCGSHSQDIDNCCFACAEPLCLADNDGSMHYTCIPSNDPEFLLPPPLPNPESDSETSSGLGYDGNATITGQSPYLPLNIPSSPTSGSNILFPTSSSLPSPPPDNDLPPPPGHKTSTTPSTPLHSTSTKDSFVPPAFRNSFLNSSTSSIASASSTPRHLSTPQTPSASRPGGGFGSGGFGSGGSTGSVGSTGSTPQISNQGPPTPASNLSQCTFCSRSIGSSHVQVKVGEYPFHLQCMLCIVCNCPLNTPSGSAAYLHGTKLMCRDHYQMSTASKCAGCGNPAPGKVLALKAQAAEGVLKFHPECLNCVFCGIGVGGSKFSRIPPALYKAAVDMYTQQRGALNGPFIEGLYDGRAGDEPTSERLCCRECMTLFQTDH